MIDSRNMLVKHTGLETVADNPKETGGGWRNRIGLAAVTCVANN